ncbi:hypothetical protein BpHYR1_022797 [Brachionus plicatilis]|uniref:Uncharacterized protein n=1 Tax=Brachionus plicatilis TaxID=10195 RepID=A0A3M7R412_BRAPC|nr:hypothetical protein BpHYR1_022797 [Brachionus plicatilis]
MIVRTHFYILFLDVLRNLRFLGTKNILNVSAVFFRRFSVCDTSHVFTPKNARNIKNKLE